MISTKKLLVIGLIFAGIAMAQRGGGGGGGDEGGGGGGAQMGGGGFGGASTKIDMMAATLTLTKDQKKAVKTIIDEAAKEATPLREQASKSRIALGEAIAAKKSDEELQQLGKASAEAAAKLTALELQTFANVVNSLGDTQKANSASLGQLLAMMNDIFHTKNWNEM